MSEKKDKKVKVIKYRKRDLCLSREFGAKADILAVLLEDGKTYTKKEVKNILNKFLKRKVK